ncbi:MAG: sigma-70 family RNA polymerase sigma factor [Aestuariivirga sp.]|uniref:sigma-70 family RNA polymerase sigma factor n=1 Tax=Aestuariivirga sp. TaxID=2650926 RepID=UPI0038CFF9A9
MTRDTPAPGQMTDAGLLEAAAAGSEAAFAEIVSRHFPPVYRLAWRITGVAADAEDVAQDVFVKLWRNPLQVREAGALKAWLMRVASNAAIDRGRRPRQDALEDAPDIGDPQARPDAPLDRAEASRLVDASIAALPARQRQAVALVYFEGMTNIEAAAAMEVTVDALESLLARARRSLRDSLSGEWRMLLGGLAEWGG